MNKLIVSLMIVFMLAGCSTDSSKSNNVTLSEPTPEQSEEVTQATPTSSPNAELAPTATIKQVEAEAHLDPTKLKANFGFADEAGQNLLINGLEQGMEQEFKHLNIAIGDKGNVLKVIFNKWQAGNDKSNGREMAHNFANLTGYLYTVVDGQATPDETYYLADEADFNVHSLLPIQPIQIKEESTSIEDSVRQSIKAAKNREIHKIWKLADVSTDHELYLVQFARLDQDMLFSLIWKDRDELTFMDYPAEIQGDGQSVWRVDDAGEVTSEMFSVLFVAQTNEGPLLGMNWWGAEGVNTFFLKKEGASFKEMDIRYGRYTSPI